MRSAVLSGHVGFAPGEVKVNRDGGGEQIWQRNRNACTKAGSGLLLLVKEVVVVGMAPRAREIGCHGESAYGGCRVRVGFHI